MLDDDARFRAFFKTAYPALRRYAINRGLPPADADDLVAGALEIGWRRIEDVPLDDPLPWLFGVARNLMRNNWRAKLRRDATIARLSSEERPVNIPADPPVDGERLRRALASLDEDDQEILRLVAWDGLSPSQAAVVLGCGPVAARSRLHRARNRLADVLGVDPRLQRSRPSGQLSAESITNRVVLEICDE